MESKSSPQILIVSGACCSPNLIHQDQLLEKNLNEAINDLSDNFEIRKVSLTQSLHSKEGLSEKEHELISVLFQVYNTRFTPALILNGEVRFAGKIPSVEQIKEALKEMGQPTQGE